GAAAAGPRLVGRGPGGRGGPAQTWRAGPGARRGGGRRGVGPPFVLGGAALRALGPPFVLVGPPQLRPAAGPARHGPLVRRYRDRREGQIMGDPLKEQDETLAALRQGVAGGGPSLGGAPGPLGRGGAAAGPARRGLPERLFYDRAAEPLLGELGGPLPEEGAGT